MNCVNAEILCQSIDENDFSGHFEETLFQKC